MPDINPMQAPAVQQPMPVRKSKIEILNSIKKMIEKGGYTIEDEKILEMFGVINTREHSKIYTLSAKLDTKPEQVIKILPKKNVYIEKYDKYETFDDTLFDRMIENYNNPRLFKPYMDIEHELGEKYADIVGLEKRQDGLYAHIVLNDIGKDAIKSNKYSYVSPEWGNRTDTEGIEHSDVLWAVTLTNIPALEGELPTLQQQIKLKKGGVMELSKKLNMLEGKLSNYKLQEAPAEGIPPELMEAIGMIKEAVAKIDELTQVAGAAEEEANKFKKKLEEIEAETSKKEKDEFFKEVVDRGQLEPSELDEWSKQFDISEESKKFVKRMLSSRPKKSGNIQLSVNLPGKSDEITSEDYAIGEDAGYDMDDPKERKRFKKEVLNDLKVHKTSLEV